MRPAHRSPGIQFDSVLGSDGVGTLIEPSSHPLHGKLVLIAPGVNWDSDPAGPDGKKPYGILGGHKPSGGRGTCASELISISLCSPAMTLRAAMCRRSLSDTQSRAVHLR